MRRTNLRRVALPLACAAALLALSGCGDDDDDETPPTTTAATVPSTVEVVGEGEEQAEQGGDTCAAVNQPPPKAVTFDAPEQVLKPGEPASATLETSCGTFVLELDTETAPKTANSFAFLAEEGAYDDTWFHRIVNGAFIQGGDPKGDGTGGVGYSIEETPPKGTSYLQGYAAMAKTAVDPPGTSGSQFFIVAQADAGLPPDYAVFGQVVEGIDVVKRIAALGDPASGQTGTPTEPVTLDRVTIETG